MPQATAAEALQAAEPKSMHSSLEVQQAAGGGEARSALGSQQRAPRSSSAQLHMH